MQTRPREGIAGDRGERRRVWAVAGDLQGDVSGEETKRTQKNELRMAESRDGRQERSERR